MSAAIHMQADVAPSVTLSSLAGALGRVRARVFGGADPVLSGLHQDSRRVVAGDVFAARSGGRSDGTRFAADAVQRGAVAVMVERGAPLPSVSAPILEVDDIRLGLALAAELVYGSPSSQLELVGVTGTNGKTTTAWLAAQVLSEAGAPAARLGTLGYAFGDDRDDAGLTTPEADEVSRLLARARLRGATAAVMEVSSHALAQVRVEALRFAVACFTNLTQDHLDFHGGMDAYAAAKLRLFTERAPRVCLINVDDEFGRRVAGLAVGRVLSVSRSAAGDVHPIDVELDARGLRGRIALPSATVEVESRLLGAHNLDNVLMTLGIADVLGLDVQRAAAALGRAAPAPGRLERCDAPDDELIVLVDYAHTPDALTRALAAVRGLTSGEVVCVFGCGGDRDPDKRPKMGEAVGRGADRAILTNDNPRGEAPEAIAAAIEPGLRRAGIAYDVELDRARAIERAVLGARAGDVVLIAGKGHEPYQLVGDEVRAFDDRLEARRALAVRRQGARG